MKHPKNSILVTYKTDKKGRPDLLSMKCYHNKRGLISPFKKRAYIDLTPFTVPVSLKSALTADNYRLNLDCTITVEISTDPVMMPVAAEKFYALKRGQISEIATDTITGGMRIAVALFDIETINLNRDEFFSQLAYHIDDSLKHLGMKTVNYRYTDMSDEDGYFAEYDREQIRKAIEHAKSEIEKEKKKYSPD
jgi:uncharacterized membrane protein YqiK